MADVLIPEWTFGDRLRKARLTAGLEIEEVARATGQAENTVRTWERGVSRPRNVFAVARTYADITGVSEAWLLAGEMIRRSVFRALSTDAAA
jgi:transcriptional regulator with XRE-family HTH domain